MSLEYTGTATNGKLIMSPRGDSYQPAGDLTRTVTIDPTADLITKETKTVIATIASL
jgi:hypothetical protein